MNFKGDRAEPIIVSICCVQCYDRKTSSKVSRADEVKRITQGFELLCMKWDALTDEPRRLARARIGRDVSVMTWDNKAGHIDINKFSTNWTNKDKVISQDVEGFRKGKKGSELDLCCLVGGLM